MQTWTAGELEATFVSGKKWAVRPIGETGIMGWIPKPWIEIVVAAHNADDACRVAAPKMSSYADGIVQRGRAVPARRP